MAHKHTHEQSEKETLWKKREPNQVSRYQDRKITWFLILLLLVTCVFSTSQCFLIGYFFKKTKEYWPWRINCLWLGVEQISHAPALLPKCQYYRQKAPWPVWQKGRWFTGTTRRLILGSKRMEKGMTDWRGLKREWRRRAGEIARCLSALAAPSRGPESRSHHPRQVAHKCLSLQVQRIWCPLPSSMAMEGTTDTQTHTDGAKKQNGSWNTLCLRFPQALFFIPLS